MLPPFPPKPGMLPRPEGEVSTPRNAVAPMCTVDDGVPASIWSAIEDALVTGMANAWVAVCAWPDGDGEPEAEESEAAVFMPMTSPSVLTSGPPESPGWMGALWPIMPVSRSASAAPSSDAVIDRPSPVIRPVATEGVPPLPRALPSATTFSPAWGLLELRVTVCRPEAFCSCSTATSWLLS
jgi:hypothetical protein